MRTYHHATILLFSLFLSLVISCSSDDPDVTDQTTDETPSETTQDTIPPAAPVLQTAIGRIDKVVLTWEANAESDLANYLIFRTDHKTGLTNTIDQAPAEETSYTDTTVRLNETFTYWLIAVDTASNESDPSEKLEVLTGDHTPPARPTDLNITIGVGQIILDWVPSTAKDVESYLIRRGESGDSSSAQIIADVTKETNMYIDNTVVNGTTYHYWMEAVDTASNKSEISTELIGTPRDSVVYQVGDVIYQDQFDSTLGQFTVQQMPGGTAGIIDGKLDINDQDGCTIWFNEKLSGNYKIEYDIVMIDAGGPNDHVRDLNCFWMATDPAQSGDVLATPRTGRFADYHCLQLYYVGYGATLNTTTRFRRYPGDCERPLLPAHDLTDPEFLHTANLERHVEIISYEGVNIYKVDGKTVFYFIDENPFTEGWFGFRTVDNHMTIDNFAVTSLL